MSKYTKKEREFMLGIAKNAIHSKLTPVTYPVPAIPPKLKKKHACFVTLSSGGHLRGCIGHMLPTQELYKDIIENATAAAFHDPRFPPLTKEEFQDLRVEISILTIPKSVSFETTEDLVLYLRKEKPGVILTKGNSRATFLPAVWDDLPDPYVFMSQLSLKSGLPPDAWMEGPTIECYRVLKVS